MRKILFFGLLCLAVATFASCSRDEPITAPDGAQPRSTDLAIDPELAAGEIIAASGWDIDPEVDLPAKVMLRHDRDGRGPVLDFEREVLVGDIAHYSWTIRLGDGPFETIGLHRVVRERRPGRPVRARESLFMVHGAGVGFVASFMANSLNDYMPADNSLPVYLASNDVDVWGIDLAWTFIPGDIADFSFAADWGYQREIDDMRVGIRVARLVRLFTGNGWRKLDLLGWSMGEGKGYAYLNEETQRPPGHQNIKGYIAVDGPIKSDDEAIIAENCEGYEAVMAAREAGEYVDTNGALAQYVAFLATSDPDGESPVFPGFTNLQVVLGALTQTHLLLGGLPAHFHLLTGVFDENFFPTGLQYVDSQFATDFYSSWVPYQPNRIFLEWSGLGCGEVDLVFDDHFADITVPVLYVAPGGASGATGSYMATQLGSSDFQSLIVSNNANPFLDIGHVDIFAGYLGIDPQQLVWQPILEWMQEH